MSDIDDLQKKVSQLKNQLHTASVSLHEALIRDCGFTKGDTVQVGKDKGVVYGFRFRDYKGDVELVPLVKKMTKAGRAHATAKLFIWELKDVQKVSA